MKIINFFKKEQQIDVEIKYAGIAKYMPLIICGGFFFVSILLFAFGPFEWNITNALKLYSFLGLSLLSLIIGYILGVKIPRKKTNSNFDINHIIYISFILFIVVYFLNSYATTGDIFPNVIRGLFNSGEAYRTSHSITSNFSTYVIYLGILISPIISFITPLYFLYFKNLSLGSKTLGTLVIVLNLCSGIAQGVINSYATLAFQIIMFLLIYLFSNFKEKSNKKKLAVLILILSIGLSFLVYYKTVMGNRLIKDSESTIVESDSINKSDGKNDSQINNNTQTNNKEETINNKKEEENISDSNMFNGSAEYIAQSKLKEKHIFSFLPDAIEGSANHLTSYITHGYKGLSLALDKDFTSSYGLGFSDFFRHNLLKVIGKTEMEEEIYQRTYMYKISQDGWVAGNVWTSFFVYPASDIGFSLTVVLIFAIGFIFSLSWRDTLESKNIFSAVLFMNLCMVICFFCANNVYFQNGGSFLTISSMFILWILSRFFGKEV